MNHQFAKHTTFSFLIVGIVGIFILSAALSQSKVKADIPNDQLLSITTTDIINAGYTGVTKQQPEGTDYTQPNNYFWVNGATENNKTTGDILNLVMVSQYTNGSPYMYALFNYGSSTQAVTVNGISGQEAQLDNGRVALNFAKGNYYIVVIGPDNQKVEKLAGIVAGKIK